MYYFDTNFRNDMHIDHRDVMSVYYDLVLDFRFGPLSIFFVWSCLKPSSRSYVSILSCYLLISLTLER